MKGYQECLFVEETDDILTAVRRSGIRGAHSRLLTLSEVKRVVVSALWPLTCELTR